MSLSSGGEQPLTRRQLRELERAREAADVAAATGQPTLQPVAAPDADQALTSPIAVVRSELAAEAPEAVEPAAASPAEALPAEAATLPEHPLTRRELRALLQAQQAEDEASTPAPEAAAAVAPTPAPASAPVRPIIVQQPEPMAVLPAVAEQPALAESFQPIVRQAEPPVVSAPASQTGGAEPRLFQPPTGHWSIGATGAFDEVLKGDEDPHSRSLESSGASTSSNALIIPSVPSIADITAPLTGAGEVLVTGSIDLPRGLGATGQLPNRFDGVELDSLFDQHEQAGAMADAAPVSAAHAISTHAPSRSVVVPPKQQSARLPTVLAITAGVIAVAVAGLFAAGFFFHLF